ncbi:MULTISPECIES: hypothetical protein [Rhodococcus]|uniref:hypothetical protein n=1 Tax=Rhodococcus TaxID=1827 RepID=UPI001B8073E2|nr:hypothetical protein [Rhodococcus phenolicus]
MARAHGAFNLVGGLWPLVHRRSFEAVFGPKHDRWLQYTTAGLLAGNGMVQLSVADTAEGHRYARRLGVSTAAVLFAIDLIYAPPGRIPKTYPADAVMEAGWLVA